MTSHVLDVIGILLALVFAATMYYHGYMILHQRMDTLKKMREKIPQECGIVLSKC